MRPLSCTILYLLLFNIFSRNGLGQSISDQMTRSHADCSDVFKNAMTVLPQLYRHKLFDSLESAIDIWRDECGNIPPVRYTQTLLDVEESKLNTHDTSLINLLISYKTELKTATRYGIE